MGLELKDSKPQNDIPNPKDIYISGEKVGTVEPHIYTDKLIWHAAINLKCGLVGLIQGHGPTPHAAIADAVLCERKEAVERAENFARLEKELGTYGVSVEELKRMASGA